MRAVYVIQAKVAGRWDVAYCDFGGTLEESFFLHRYSALLKIEAFRREMPGYPLRVVKYVPAPAKAKKARKP